jgi:hypothetical protein
MREVPEEGLVTHLKEFGFVKVFRKVFRKEDVRHYILFLPDLDTLKQTPRAEFQKIHDIHWGTLELS